MENVSETVKAAIERSKSHNEIVHLQYETLAEHDALRAALLDAADDSSVSNDELETWVEDPDDENEMVWRVHLPKPEVMLDDGRDPLASY